MRSRSGNGIPFLLAGTLCLQAAETIPLNRVAATFHNGAAGELDHVINGLEAEPHGWSVLPRLSEPQALVVTCAQPVEAPELDFTLFFRSGRPNSSILEFALFYTTSSEPSLGGKWEPLEIQRFTAEVVTLQRAERGHLRATFLPDVMTGVVPDDTYRVSVLLPGGLATGFRLQVFPIRPYEGGPAWMSWGTPHDFVLTEFRVEIHARETTNIALHCPVKASHPLFAAGMPEDLAASTNDFHRLFAAMTPGALTDGLPSTIAHPRDEHLGTNFYFEIDLGRVANLDHIGLRTRGDGYLDRFSRMILRLYEQNPEMGVAPIWEGMDRADGSHPEAGTADIVRGALGHGNFRARYLRLLSDNPAPLSPQLAEVEVYETRTPEVISARADGRDIPVRNVLDLPPGVRRLSLWLRIPQTGLPPEVAFRWRLEGDLETWQLSRFMTIDMPCPRPGRTVFEAQALHSDREWDATILRLPIIAREHLWEKIWFQWSAAMASLIAVAGFVLNRVKRRTAREIAVMQGQAALAEERARIARDMHDDLGASLAHIALLGELAQSSIGDDPARTQSHVDDMARAAQKLTRSVDEIVWTLNPANDTIARFGAFVGDFAQEFLQAAGIECRLDFPDTWPDRALAPKLRRHLFLLLKEALHNIVSHSGAKTVRLSIRAEPEFMRLTAADDGCGFDPENVGERRPGGGHGLANMRRRIQEMGGTFAIQSVAATGTTVVIEVPL